MPKTCNSATPGLLLVLLLLAQGCASTITDTPPNPAINPQLQQAYAEALADMKVGRDEEAIRQLLAISEDSPGLSGPHTNLGILYIRGNKLQEAEQSLLKATELNPRNKVAYNYLGIAYRSLGQFDDAEKAYLKAIEIDDKYHYAHLNLGILYDLYKADLKKALSHYQQYQDLTAAEDKTVEKWIVDLKRRESDMNTVAGNAEGSKG